MMKLLMRRASWILCIALVLTAVSGFFAVQLFKNLRTDFEELLPTKARSVTDLAAVQDRMEATQSLAVLFFSKQPAESKRFVTAFAQAVERELPDLASHVEYRIDREIRFFKHRQALMMSTGDLRKIRSYVDDRIGYEQEIRNPLNIFSGISLREPRLDLNALASKYKSRLEDYAKFKDGYYALPDGSIRVVLIYLSGSAVGISQALKLKDGVEKIVTRLNPKSYASDLEVKYTGDVQNLLEERASIISDLELSTIAVAILVALVLLAYYRNLRATLALGLSLLAGTLWTFGASYFAVGYLNANSAFLGSIVMGNGINFGVVLLAQYLEERRTHPHAEALPKALRGALPGTLTAALAASLAYGSLGFTSFRGFKQFGIIGLIGMILCWIAAYTVLPAALCVLDGIKPLIPHGTPASQRRGFAHWASLLVTRFPRGVLASGVAVTIALAGLAARTHGPFLETDTSQLRDKRSLAEGSGYLSKYLDEIFGRYLSPLVVLPHTREQTQAVVREMKKLKESQGPSSLISSVYSIDDFIGTEQASKISILRDIRTALPARLVAQLSDQDAKLVRDALAPEAFRKFGTRDLPPVIQARFRERDGSVGKPALVEPVFDPAIMNEFSNQKKLIDEVREVADRVDPKSAVVGQLPLTVDMIGSITSDGPRATFYAFMAVMVLAAILFRRPAAILQAVFALLLGVLWMACAARGLGLKINFLNFIALPITFGIGVDYGVNILARIRHEGAGRLAHIVATTGGAVSLASLTTIIGYGSLLIAGNQGFVSFGRLAVLGEITCLTAAVLILPAFIQWRHLRNTAGPAETAAADGAESNRSAA